MVETIKKDNLNVIFSIWSHFSKRRKTQFLLLLILTIFTSFAEILSLGTLIPFLAALTDQKLCLITHLLNHYFDLLIFLQLINVNHL